VTAAEPIAATPSTAPIWRAALTIPAARPERPGSTAAIAIVARLGVIAANPAPNSRYGTTKTAYGVSGPVSAMAATEMAAAMQPAAVTRGVPHRLPALPANGASTMNDTLIGMMLSPASNGLYPRTFWKNSVSR